MKIGIDIRNIGKKRTGDEAVFLNLVKNLAEIDSQNEYLLFTDITDAAILRDMVAEPLGIANRRNLKIVPLKCLNKFTWNFWTLPNYLRKNPVDIYLTQYITPFFVSKKVKIVTIIHDLSFNFYPRFIKKTDLFFLKTLIPISLKRADKIIGVSRFTRDEIIKYYKISPEKADWIHNAVSKDFLSQDASDEKIKLVKKKYKLPDKYILYIGTLQPRKNLPVLIEACTGIKEKLGNIKLVIAGGRGHNYDPRIDKAVSKCGLEKTAVFPGFIDEEDKAALMAGAQIFCFPSLYEGFGIPILEAMSAGTPVVASNIAPHREIAENSALFFDPRNPQALGQQIEKLCRDENLRQELAQKGKNRVQNFSWEKTAEKMLFIFNSLH